MIFKYKDLGLTSDDIFYISEEKMTNKREHSVHFQFVCDINYKNSIRLGELVKIKLLSMKNSESFSHYFYVYLKCKCGHNEKAYGMFRYISGLPLLLSHRNDYELFDKIMCSKCGEISSNNAQYGKYTKPKVLSTNIFKEKDRIRYSVIKGEWRYLSNIDEIIYSSYMYRLIFNPKTRNMYYAEKKIGNKRWKNIRCANYLDKVKSGYNILPGKDYFTLTTFLKECYESIGMSDKFDVEIFISNSNRKHTTTINEIFKLRYPGIANIDLDVKELFYLTSKRKPSIRKLLSNPSVKPKQIIKELYGRTEKSFIKTLISINYNQEYVAMFSRLFKDINCLVTVLKAFNNSIGYERFNAVKQNDIATFIEYVTEPRLARWARKSSSSFTISLLEDSIHMYTEILKHDVTMPLPRKYKTLTEFHDILSCTHKKIKKPLKFFEIPRNIELLDQSVENSYKFKVARNSHELIDIGTIMNICVGSYDYRVLEGRCYIVSLLKNNYPVTCIEIVRSDNLILAQCRGKNNSRLEEKEASLVRKWCKEHKIESEHISDIGPRIRVNNYRELGDEFFDEINDDVDVV